MLSLALEHKFHALLQLYLIDVSLHLGNLLNIEFGASFSDELVGFEGVVNYNLLVLF
jgi:hypothetical protein